MVQIGAVFSVVCIDQIVVKFPQYPLKLKGKVQDDAIDIYKQHVGDPSVLQNNSVFDFDLVWKTSMFKRQSWKTKLEHMNQVINLKSLGFTWRKNSKLTGGESPQIFDPHIAAIVHFVVPRRCCKTRMINLNQP